MNTTKVLFAVLLLLILPNGANATQTGVSAASSATVKIFEAPRPTNILLTVRVDLTCAGPPSTFTVNADGTAIGTLSGPPTPVSQSFSVPDVKQVSVGVSAPSACYFVQWQIETVRTPSKEGSHSN